MSPVSQGPGDGGGVKASVFFQSRNHSGPGRCEARDGRTITAGRCPAGLVNPCWGSPGWSGSAATGSPPRPAARAGRRRRSGAGRPRAAAPAARSGGWPWRPRPRRAPRPAGRPGMRTLYRQGAAGAIWRWPKLTARGDPARDQAISAVTRCTVAITWPSHCPSGRNNLPVWERSCVHKTVRQAILLITGQILGLQHGFRTGAGRGHIQARFS